MWKAAGLGLGRRPALCPTGCGLHLPKALCLWLSSFYLKMAGSLRVEEQTGPGAASGSISGELMGEGGMGDISTLI